MVSQPGNPLSLGRGEGQADRAWEMGAMAIFSGVPGDTYRFLFVCDLARVYGRRKRVAYLPASFRLSYPLSFKQVGSGLLRKS